MQRVLTIQGGDALCLNEIQAIHKTKDIYDTDNSFVTAYKIMNYFDIGDRVRIAGVEPMHFKSTQSPYRLHIDMECSIVGTAKGYCVVYPKGFLVILRIAPNRKIFKYQIKDKYYEIWRSR